MQNIPDWMPFACLLTGKLIPQKAMWTRVIEGALIAALGSAGTMFIGLPIAVANMQKDNEITAKALHDHIVWAQKQVEKRDAQMVEAAKEVQRRDDQLLYLMSSIDRCLRERTCTK